MEESKKVTNIFWTGGLDSTFRVVQLLTTTGHLVQPHYLVMEDKATGVEIDAMIKIRKCISEKFPEVMDRFLPTIYTNSRLIQKFNDVDEEVFKLRNKIKVIEQYQLMAHYCREHNISKIDVAIIYLEGEMDLFTDYKDSLVFKSFAYPTIELSKKMIHEIAVKEGWEKILLMTSFCKRPIIKIKPCGVCSPCTTAVIAGMGFRLPLISYLIAKFQLPFRNYIREHYVKLKGNKFLISLQKKLYE